MKDGLKYFTDTHLTSIGLLLFFGFFIATLFWVFRKGSKQFYATTSQIPLVDDEVLYSNNNSNESKGAL